VFTKNKKYSGFLLTEVIVAAGVLGVILIALALSMYGFAKFNRYQLVRQQCTAAAQA
jgi:type II secretory pathway pseudopilin PulG